MLVTFLFSVLLLSPLADARPRGRRGLNDWNKPCFEGECFYDLPDSGRRGHGSLRIWGSPNAISDITPAAGWTILGCSPESLAQDIRIVCNSEEDEKRCNHLYRRIGAAGKLVRLPEAVRAASSSPCGKSAFARVAKTWVPKDQTIPADVAPRIVRRSGAQPLVVALTLDTNFAAINPTLTGPVSIAIAGTNVPGFEGNLTVVPAAGEASNSGGLFSWVKDAWEKFNNFDKSVITNAPPIDISKNYPLFSQSLFCAGPPAFDASVRADASVNAHADISLGLAAVGTIVPPELTEFGAFVGLDADIRGSVSLVGNAAGRADSGQLTLYQATLPTLEFPGLLTIGPSFKILGQATANVDVGVNLKVDLSYTVSGAKIIYPPIPDTKSKGIFIPGNAPLKLSVTGNVASSSVATAQLNPRIDLAVNALGGLAKATVLVNIDSRSTVRLNLNAAGNAGGSIETPTGGTKGGASASVDGCVTAGAALNANVGADAKFFNLFDRSTSVSLYAKDWELFQKCFAAQTGKRVTSERADLSFVCPSWRSSSLVTVV
ncbi:hypothetical protein DXG03_005688 [Asterophora parasitica]|uniref:Uncharacterized protein n=1 Tax=Asterophora parasitica TaxID=117018 RepID=A0A9P7K7F5_9AGAR|nr:hypothetical protein DXG03_005688 [Asterophora parasitica]